MDAIPVNHIELVDGNAIIIGTTLKAALVASMVVKANAAMEDIMEHFALSRAQVHAALAYYYDHENMIEATFQKAEHYVRQHGIDADEHLTHLRQRQKHNDE